MRDATEVKLTDVYTGKVFKFPSAKKACEFLNRYDRYIFDCASKGRKYATSSSRVGFFSNTYYYEIEGKDSRHNTNVKKEAVIHKVQLCSYCGNCNRFNCEFIASGGNTPVEGWVAEENCLYGSEGLTKTWSISECPKFTADIATIKDTAKMTVADWAALAPYENEIRAQQIEYMKRHGENGK